VDFQVSAIWPFFFASLTAAFHFAEPGIWAPDARLEETQLILTSKSPGTIMISCFHSQLLISPWKCEEEVLSLTYHTLPSRFLSDISVIHRLYHDGAPYGESQWFGR